MENSPVQELLVVATQKYGVLNSAEQKLFTLAQEKFQELSASEYELFRAIANGKPLDYRTGVAADDQPENASQWGEERILRGDRLRWLCVEPAVGQLCLPQGLDVAGAKIEGALNLSFSDVAIPLRFAGCSFAEALRLQQTKLRRLDLSGTHLAASQIATVPTEPSVPTSIDAREVEVSGSIFLLQDFAAVGTVILRGAKIEGNLVCSKGQFLQSALALDLEGAAVKGNVSLSNGFEAKGTVDLTGATIGSNLDCNNGKFLHTETALFVHNAQVTGSVFLRGFEAQGEVNLAGATIGGNLECDNGQFLHATTALNAGRLNVTGHVFLRHGFKAQGTVNLATATIGSVLQIVSIKESQDLSLELQFAKVHVLEHAVDSFPASGKLQLNGLVYESWGRRSPQSADDLLKWLRLQPQNAFSPQPYEQLAKVLRSTGSGDEVVKVLIGKERDQLQFGRLKGFSKCWKRVLGLTIAYGYRPQNAIYMAICVVVVGAFLFGVGYQQGLITPTEKDCSSTPSSTPINDCAKYPNYPKFNPLIYSLDVFVPIIDLRLKSAWQPSANAGETEDPILHRKWKLGACLRYYFWLHIFLGWGLTTLWVAGFSGLVRNTNK